MPLWDRSLQRLPPSTQLTSSRRALVIPTPFRRDGKYLYWNLSIPLASYISIQQTGNRYPPTAPQYLRSTPSHVPTSSFTSTSSHLVFNPISYE